MDHHIRVSSHGLQMGWKGVRELPVLWQCWLGSVYCDVEERAVLGDASESWGLAHSMSKRSFFPSSFHADVVSLFGITVTLCFYFFPMLVSKCKDIPLQYNTFVPWLICCDPSNKSFSLLWDIQELIIWNFTKKASSLSRQKHMFFVGSQAICWHSMRVLM